MKNGAVTMDHSRRSGGHSLHRMIAMGFLLIALLSCAAVGTVGTWLRARGVRDDLFNRLEVMCNDKSRILDAWFFERRGDAEVLSAERDIVDISEKHAQGEPFDEVQSRAKISRFKKAYGYHTVFIADPANGRVFLSTDPDDATKRHLSDQHRQQVLAEQRILISDAFLDPLDQRIEMIVASPVRSEQGDAVVGILVFEVDVVEQIAPLLVEVKPLGATDETVLVNQDGVVQLPLRHQPNATLNLTIESEPARRGADGRTGRIQSVDYRQVPVMAAYGHISQTHWGLVVKQDLAEINAPVVTMAVTMSVVSVGALFAAIGIGLLIARRIARPAVDIAAVAERIGGGDMASRAEEAGPSELRLVARNLNFMVERLAAWVRTASALGDVYAAAAAHNRMADLLNETLPRITEATRSQVAVMYLANERDGLLQLVFTYGIARDRVAQKLGTTPSDHLLSKVVATGKADVTASIPDDYELSIATQVGDIRARSLLGIPLMHMGRAVGVVGLASVYEYGEEELGIAETLSLNLAAPILACLASEKTEMMSEELRAANEELTAANEELESQAQELQEQTEELEAQRLELEEADRLKSEFLSNMSHELRTPLNSVLALSQLMISHSAGRIPEEDLEHMRVIERNGRQLLNLINDILDLSKIESGRLETLCGEFDPGLTIRQALETTQPLTEEKGLELSVHIADLPAIHSDEDKFRQIVLNLLSNAVKFTDQGEIEVTAMAMEDKLIVAIRDTGTGISAADLLHIFNEFRQVDGSTTRQHEGTGLGLTICQKLAGLLGGEVTVDSELGQGSTFTLTLPLHCPSISELTGSASCGVARVLPRPSTGSGKRTILVVEDNEVAALQIRTALEENGYTVNVATGGREAIESIQRTVPDAVVLDLMMPDVDGFQVMEQIRASEWTAVLPILVLTAKEITAEDRARLKHNNIQQLIQKGKVDRDALVASVARLVESPDPAESSASPSRVLAEPSSARRRPTSKTILVVEDNPDNMRTITAILRDMDAQYVTAEDGRQAVEVARESRPGLILMDIQLPGVSGLDATRQIKSDPDLAGTPIIAVTAKVMKGDRAAILAAGCDDYVSKPIDQAELTGVIHKWMGYAAPG